LQFWLALDPFPWVIFISMGDKSPKATNKKASQKQANTKANTQKKSNAAASKPAASGKK
jgi:hypothetical protein